MWTASLVRPATVVVLAVAVVCIASTAARGGRDAAADPAQSSPAAPVEITALANAGVLVRSGSEAVLIDALFREGVAGYATLDEGASAELETARGVYAEVDLVLVTHWHRDHFDPQAVGRFLVANRRAQLVAARQVTERLRLEFASWAEIASRARAVTPGPGAADALTVNGMEVRVLRIAHSPSRNFPDEHVAQSVTVGGRRLVHVGDADPARANFSVAARFAPFDIALVPYWFLVSAGGRAVVKEQLRSRHVVALHVEPAEAGRVRAEVERQWPGAVILAAAGDAARF